MTKDNLLLQVEKLEIDAKEFGFYWQNIDQLLEQIRSECAEVDEAWQKNDRTHLQEEIGDLIHATLCLAVFCQLDPTETLQKSVHKLQKRFDTLVDLTKKDGYENLHNKPFNLLMYYWNRAKEILKG
ncbi:MAG: MazG nucleotide pyrophosphohydrolase domain-containing protein [Parachlamydiaceae bacterium]